MAKPKITDRQGREARIQLSQDKRIVDLYLGPEKTRHRSPLIRWWAAHRTFDKANAQRFARLFTQLASRMK